MRQVNKLISHKSRTQNAQDETNSYSRILYKQMYISYKHQICQQYKNDANCSTRC